MDSEISNDGNEWQRLTDDPDIRGVGVHREDDSVWPFTVTVSVAEFLRDDPLEDELRTKMDASLRAVPGVTDVAEEDREVWIVSGDASAEALIRAAASVVDELADRASAYIDALDD